MVRLQRHVHPDSSVAVARACSVCPYTAIVQKREKCARGFLNGGIEQRELKEGARKLPIGCFEKDQWMGIIRAQPGQKRIPYSSLSDPLTVMR